MRGVHFDRLLGKREDETIREGKVRDVFFTSCPIYIGYKSFRLYTGMHAITTRLVVSLTTLTMGI